MTRPLTIAMLIAAIAFPTAHQQSAPTPIRKIKNHDKFQAWAREVWAHTPGTWDESAQKIAAWSAQDLDEHRVHLQMMSTLISRRGGRSNIIDYTMTGQEVTPDADYPLRLPANTRQIRMADVPALIGLTDDAFTDATGTQFLKRAALLHTDIVLAAPEGSAGPVPRQALPRGRTTVRAPSARVVVDGEDAGYDVTPVHWEIGRAALAGVLPSPSGDDMTLAWYRAVAAFMEGWRQFGFAAPHLLQGQFLFPADPWIQFFNGVLHEAMSAPAVQAALATVKSTPAFRPGVQRAELELLAAERFYRRAVELHQGLALARLHLGRVIGLLGRHDDAIAEISRALPLLDDNFERYYAHLFLGVEEEARGRPAEAQAAYERARDLFPHAQSPHLALSQLAWQRADRDGALEAFRALGAVPNTGGLQDPWWVYYWSVGRYSASLLDSMKRIAAEDLRR